jgi:hypothetical protein
VVGGRNFSAVVDIAEVREVPSAVPALLLMAPSLLHELLGVPLRSLQTGNLLARVGLCISPVLISEASDRFGARRACFQP